MNAIERTDPPYETDERTMLEAWLEYHRATLALKCEGLTPDQLRTRSVPPSALSLVGLDSPYGRGREQLVPILVGR